MTKEAPNRHGPRIHLPTFGSREWWLGFAGVVSVAVLIATMGRPTLEAIQIYNGWKSAPTTDLNIKTPGSENTLVQPGVIGLTVLNSPCAVRRGPNTILAQGVSSLATDRFCAVLPVGQTAGTLYRIELTGNALGSAQMPACMVPQVSNCFRADGTVTLDLNKPPFKGAGWSNGK